MLQVVDLNIDYYWHSICYIHNCNQRPLPRKVATEEEGGRFKVKEQP
jgi:hypothetical protein